METDQPKKPKGKGGRPKIDPAAVRRSTIGVRVSEAEYTALRERAEEMGLTLAQWLRHAALTRRLPSPPVAAINREHYAELARLAGNLNQLAHHANEGQMVSVNEDLLQQVSREVSRLRLALLGMGSTK